ncbi:MAG: D-serine ammonia-lyase [Clostridia bacterium]|nr:D-serine ammonia-lyase [Clostridia bacterium]
MDLISEELKEKNSVLRDLASLRETFWENPEAALFRKGEGVVDPEEAEARLLRFAPFLREVFPETGDGIIESPLLEIPSMKKALSTPEARFCEDPVAGRLFLKCDHALPIAGSVKARGGIYEVLKFAEETAIREALIEKGGDTRVLRAEKARRVFSRYSVAVGSTGNLGLSVGIMGAAFGFSATVHMSRDARAWKKRKLRENGVTVKEYGGDYEKAVEAGRREAEKDPSCHFVDDENSLDLFAGYATAGKRLASQLDAKGISVDRSRRLYVYLPCGVGGAPGGIAYGLKEIFGENADCFTAEPTHAPAVIAGLASGLGNGISAADLGLDGVTAADGLAVGRPSKLACRAMRTRLAGACTVKDETLYRALALLYETEGIYLEPSAAAGLAGLRFAGKGSFPAPDENSIHVVWSTGGGMVPAEEREADLRKGRESFRTADSVVETDAGKFSRFI